MNEVVSNISARVSLPCVDSDVDIDIRTMQLGWYFRVYSRTYEYTFAVIWKWKWKWKWEWKWKWKWKW